MMVENKQPAAGDLKAPQANLSEQKSPQVSTRSRDEFESDIRAMRDQGDDHNARPNPETVRDRAQRDADAHRAAHSGSDDREVPRMAALEPARKKGGQDSARRDASSRERAHRNEDDREKSSAELEREVEYERQQLTRTLEQIRSRVSPGQVMDQAWNYARDAGAGEFARNFGRSVRDNPLPVVLVGASIGWLMMSSGSGSANARSSYGSGGRISSLGKRASGVSAEVSDRVGEAADTSSGLISSAKDGLDRVKDHAASAFDSASDTGSAVASHALDTMQYTGDAARSSMRYASEYAQDASEGIQSSFARLAKEHPLALGAIGIAVGAAITAMLPPTRIENRLMGRTSDALKDQVANSVERQYENARDIVKETAEEVSEEFEGRGMSPKAVTDAVADSTRKASDAVKEVAEGAKSEVKQQDGAKGSSDSSGSTAGLSQATGKTKAGMITHPETSDGPGR